MINFCFLCQSPIAKSRRPGTEVGYGFGNDVVCYDCFSDTTTKIESKKTPEEQLMVVVRQLSSALRLEAYRNRNRWSANNYYNESLKTPYSIFYEEKSRRGKGFQ